MGSSRPPLQQIVGTSPVSVDDAIDRALVLARETYGEPDSANPGRSHDHYLNSVIDRRRNRRAPNTVDRRF